MLEYFILWKLRISRNNGPILIKISAFYSYKANKKSQIVFVSKIIFLTDFIFLKNVGFSDKFNFLLLLLTFYMIYSLKGKIKHIVFFVYLIRLKWHICFNYIKDFGIDYDNFSKNVGFSDKFYFLLLLLTFYMIYCFKGGIKYLIVFVYLIRIKWLICFNYIQGLSIDCDNLEKKCGFFWQILFSTPTFDFLHDILLQRGKKTYNFLRLSYTH